MSKRKKFLRRAALLIGLIALVGIITSIVLARMDFGIEVPPGLYMADIRGTFIGSAIAFVLACLFAILFIHDDRNA